MRDAAVFLGETGFKFKKPLKLVGEGGLVREMQKCLRDRSFDSEMMNTWARVRG